MDVVKIYNKRKKYSIKQKRSSPYNIKYEKLRHTLMTNNIFFQTIALRNNQFKIITKQEEETLYVEEINWHSYEIKQTRNIKEMVRGLPSMFYFIFVIYFFTFIFVYS